MDTPTNRSYPYQPGDLVILDGKQLLQVVKGYPSERYPDKAAYTLRPLEHHRWEKYAWEGRLQPAAGAVHQPALFDLG